MFGNNNSLCGDVYMKSSANVPNNRAAQAEEDEQSEPSVGYLPSYYPYYAYNQQMTYPGYYPTQVYYPQGYDPNLANSQTMMQNMQQYQLSAIHDSVIHQVSDSAPVEPEISADESSSSETKDESVSKRRHFGITRDKSKWVLKKREPEPKAWGSPVLPPPEPSDASAPSDDRWRLQPPRGWLVSVSSLPPGSGIRSTRKSVISTQFAKCSSRSQPCCFFWTSETSPPSSCGCGRSRGCFRAPRAPPAS